MADHTPLCVAHNTAPLFETDYQCVCEPPRKARKAKAPPKPKAPSNPCYGAEIRRGVEVATTHWGIRGEFKPTSLPMMKAYAASQGHTVPKVQKKDADGNPVSRESFAEEAIRALRVNYPKDPIYPQVEGYRILIKTRSPYLESFQPRHRDGSQNTLYWDDAIHDVARHTPKTLRLSMQIMQVLPKPLDEEDLAALAPDDPRRLYNEIRKCIIPRPGHVLCSRDYSGIEPIMVAYDAKAASFLRACQTTVHSWFAAFVIGRPVDLAQSTDAIMAHYEALAAGGPYTITVGGKRRTFSWSTIRRACKTAGMASLYMGGPKGIAHANPDVFGSTAEARYYQDAFFDLCPEIKQWHWTQAEAAERKTYLETPIGFRPQGFEMFSYKATAPGVWDRKISHYAKKNAAVVPQHLGAMYLATATTTLAAEHPAYADYLRLLIHDEILSEVPLAEVEAYDAALQAIMERPHPLMPLWPEAEALLGQTHLSVRTEGKRSAVSWGDM